MRRIAFIVVVLLIAVAAYVISSGGPRSGAGGGDALGSLVDQVRTLLGWGEPAAPSGTEAASTPPAPSPSVASAPPAKPADPAADAERDRLAKFNEIVGTLNFASSWIEGSFERYAQAVDLARGPTGGENPVGMRSTSSSQSSLEGLIRMLDEKPGTDLLDRLARRFAETGLKLIPLLDRAGLYYDQQDYKDDGYAKGRAMHEPLVTAHRDFAQATDALRAEIRRIGEEARDKEMAKLKAEGRMLRYNVMLNLKQSRQALEFIRAELRAKHDIAAIDIDALKSWNDAMDGTLQAIRELAEADPATVVREYRDTGRPTLDRYVSASEEFLRTAKYVQRSVRDHEPVSDSAFVFGGGGPNDIIGRFNDMVAGANALNR